MDRLLGNPVGQEIDSRNAALEGSARAPAGLAQLVGVSRELAVARIAIDRIQADPAQPRRDFDPESLERLAESMIARGQLQPIRVRWDEPAAVYRIICGERRWRAASLAGMPSLSCVIAVEPMSEADRLADQLIENALREDLKPIEQARAFQTLMDRNNWSTRQLANELSLSQPQVVRSLALLKLPEDVREEVQKGTLAPATAYEIGKLKNPEEQKELAGRVAGEKLTRQEAAASVRDRRTKTSRGSQRPKSVELRVGDEVTVTVKYRESSRLTLIQALRTALKMAQERKKRDEEAA